MKNKKTTYREAILEASEYLLKNYKEVFILGQGVTNPWYAGNSIKDLDKKFGPDRIIDTPISEQAVTGVAIGASLCGYRPVVIHPRMDFMLLSADQIVNQAAKWSYMFGGQASAPITIRSIINRGGEQGAQHSQALHSWFAHIPGLTVVMPSTPQDARDLLIGSVLSNNPVIYIDDRWLYEIEQELPEITEKDLGEELPKVIHSGSDATLISCGYLTQVCLEAVNSLKKMDMSCELIDLRVIKPLDFNTVVESVKKTRRFCVVDGGWSTCGLAGEIIAGVMERIDPKLLNASPIRLTLPDAPAPASAPLEELYYLKSIDIEKAVIKLLQ